jgi:hypothetical protein
MPEPKMSASDQTSIEPDEFADPAVLHLDLRNPRVPDEEFESEDAVLEYLVDFADVNELVNSIMESGWLDYEPLIVLSPENIVLEGNRRLAALRIIADADLRQRLKLELRKEPGPEALPTEVRIRKVADRRQARDYIGFKHINGPFKWDSLAKAKYAADWLRDGGDVGEVSRRIGDGHSTVVRLINGWFVLQQSSDVGFERGERTKKAFFFSHLYTALARPNTRRFLGLPEESSQVLAPNPVPTEKHGQLKQLMTWLYGQKSQPTVIGSQNPDLNHLVDVLGNANALAMLEVSGDLADAFDLVQDKSQLFQQALMNSIRSAEETLKLVGSFDGRADLMSAGDNLRRTVLYLHGAMKQAVELGREGDSKGAAR